MTTVAYALGRPRPAPSRGGDCRAHELGPSSGGGGGYEDGYAGGYSGGAATPGRNVHGPHRFATTTNCQISNGMLRLTVGASGAAPSLAVEVQRRHIAIGDVYVDTYVDLYGGTLDPGTWLAAGTITIDSSLLTALLTAVQIVRISPEAVTLRLVAPVMADAFVTLRRGERMVRIQHGNTRGPQVSTNRRVRWTDSPSPTGATSYKRVEEAHGAGIEGIHRFVAALDTATVNAGAFSSTAAGVTTARFGAGVGTAGANDGAIDMHKQLRDTSRPKLITKRAA